MLADTLTTVAMVVVVTTLAAQSFIWTWFRFKRQGLVGPERESRVRALEERLALLERENAAAAVEIERLGEMQRFLSKTVKEQADTKGSIAGGN